jgi:hypothetical protein
MTTQDQGQEVPVTMGWYDFLEDSLASWAEQAQGYRLMHEKAFSHYNKISFNLTIPAIILSTLTGVANFGQESLQPYLGSDTPLYIGAFSIAAAMLSTIAKYVRADEKAELHRNAMVNWDKLYRTIVTELTQPRRVRIPAQEFLLSYREERHRLSEQAPTIPYKIRRWFKEEYKEDFANSNISKPNILSLVDVQVFRGETVDAEAQPHAHPHSPRNQNAHHPNPPAPPPTPQVTPTTPGGAGAGAGAGSSSSAHHRRVHDTPPRQEKSTSDESPLPMSSQTPIIGRSSFIRAQNGNLVHVGSPTTQSDSPNICGTRHAPGFGSSMLGRLRRTSPTSPDQHTATAPTTATTTTTTEGPSAPTTRSAQGNTFSLSTLQRTNQILRSGVSGIVSSTKADEVMKKFVAQEVKQMAEGAINEVGSSKAGRATAGFLQSSKPGQAAVGFVAGKTGVVSSKAGEVAGNVVAGMVRRGIGSQQAPPPPPPPPPPQDTLHPSAAGSGERGGDGTTLRVVADSDGECAEGEGDYEEGEGTETETGSGR